MEKGMGRLLGRYVSAERCFLTTSPAETAVALYLLYNKLSDEGRQSVRAGSLFYASSDINELVMEAAVLMTTLCTICLL